jgi:hypothetical protein
MNNLSAYGEELIIFRCWSFQIVFIFAFRKLNTRIYDGTVSIALINFQLTLTVGEIHY